ncbi:MAG: hypothetical protein LBR65_05560 [Culturomica sp.]|jgi:hypothetical protein|nr:hypothetical protein [Culturomica sp.]
MNGFILDTGDKKWYGASRSGITDILLSNKEGPYRLYFGCMERNGIPYTWYSADLEPGDRFTIIYDNIEQVSPAVRVNLENTPEDDQLLLESYKKLKQELIDDGLIVP